MLGNITKFGVIPRGPMSTVSYGAITAYFAVRSAILGIKPGKLAAWVFVRQGVVGITPGRLSVVETVRHSVIEAGKITHGRLHVTAVNRYAFFDNGA